MCIFSGNVSAVANTNIFARGVNGSQFLVYSMQYQAQADLAMILPLPTPIAAAEDALRFIDLSGYPQFFTDMATGFIEFQSRTFSLAPAPAARPNLIVHEVGSFEASFVPRLQDFSRLDARFCLPAGVWEQLPIYSDYGFAVFKLQAGAKNIHPMAFEFPRRDSDELFFPTIHIHDGTVEAQAHFDHALYCQTPHPLPDWRISSDESFNGKPLRAEKFMDCEKTQGVVDAGAPIQSKRLRGMFDNRDVVIGER